MRSPVLDVICGCGLLCLIAVLTVACGRESAVRSGAESQSGVIASRDGVPIAYSAYGAGSPTLAFVHGWSCDRSYWNEQVAPFSRDFSLVTVDLAGHGESGLGRREWSIEAFAGDVAAVVEGLDLQDVVLIGHSMGGAVVLETARQLPGRVQGLVLVDSYGDFDTTSTPEEIEQFLKPFREDFVRATRAGIRGLFAENADPALIERIATDMSAAPPEVALASLESAAAAMYGREKTRALLDLDVPVFAINADDGTTDLSSMERHGVEAHVVPGVGHFLMLEDPDAFNSALTTVVQSIVD